MLRKKTNKKTLGFQEVLLNNMVDEDIQRFLSPMDLMQRFLLIPKYKIRANYITSNGLWANVFCLISTCLIIMLFLYNTMFISRTIDESTVTFMHACIWLDFTTYTISAIINFLTCILQSKFYVELVLNIQESHRSLYDETFQSFVKLNWVYCIFFVIYQIKEAIIIQALFYKEVTLITLALQYTLSSIDFNIVMAIRLMQFINLKFELWLKELRLYSSFTESSYARLRTELIWNRMYHMYSCVTKCYNLFKKSFEYVIMYHVAEIIIHATSYVQMLIEFTKLTPDRWTNINHYFAVGEMMLWIVKKLVLHSLLAMALEKFYMIQEDVEDICLMAQARCAPDGCKMMCKNVRRLRICEADKFKLCYLFPMDAKFPLRLLSLITTHIIVLLQFAYL